MEQLNHSIAVDGPASLHVRRFSLSISDCLRMLGVVAVVLLVYRIALMWILPLADTTEARYGEIARLTVANSFWLMPHVDPQTPFFAKPPLSTWAAALSMFVLGQNEFAARLPSLLVSLLAARTTMAFATAMQVKKRWLVLPVLATCPLFFVSAGAVMTDAVQMSVVTAALYFAWRAIDTTSEAPEDRAARRHWRLAFWTLVGVGALCKGLADWALIGLPVIAYAVVERRPLQMIRQLFDPAGICIAVAIFLPWYLAAEHFYPGFLNYFIIGEHFSRFLVPGWTGDRYGTAHVEPLGTIWIYWAAAIFPWLGVFAGGAIRLVFGKRGTMQPLERFLWCATLAPLVFFTFAHNIIWTYGLTAIVPFAVLVARWIENASATTLRNTSVAVTVLAIAAVLCAPAIVRNVNGNSERDLVAASRQVSRHGPLVYRTPPTHSSRFYTQDNLVYQPQAPVAVDGVVKDMQLVVVDKDAIEQQHVPADDVVFKGTRRALIVEK
jgi:4-amino-4-deoxy-L-arabinose transferase-like glycosyltransferase